jgi:hypothetical protein
VDVAVLGVRDEQPRRVGADVDGGHSGHAFDASGGG